MKMRTTRLAVLPALALPLLFCARPPLQGPMAREAPVLGMAAIPPVVTASPLAPGAWTPIAKANFPHEKHVEEQKIECVQCHHETNAKALTMPHQKYFEDFWIDCNICHRPKTAEPLGPQACSACHHLQSGDIADETLSAKVVMHKSCWACHEVGTGAAASATCKTCHPARS